MSGIKRFLRSLERTLKGGRWTRVENVEHAEEYREEFANIFDQTMHAINDSLPDELKNKSNIAATEKETCYLLYSEIRKKKLKTVIETGSYLGLSAFVCGAALKKNFEETGLHGQVYSISLDFFYKLDHPLTRAANVCQKLGLDDTVHFLEGTSVALSSPETSDPNTARMLKEYCQTKLIPENREQLLPRLVSLLGEVELVYFDALHYESFQMAEIASVLGYLPQNASVYMDDVLRTNRREDAKAILRAIVRFDFQLHRILDYLRCGFRFYSLPWVVDAFRWTDLARVTLFKSRNGFLRVMRLNFNPLYNPNWGPLSIWYAPGNLTEFLAKYKKYPQKI